MSQSSILQKCVVTAYCGTGTDGNGKPVLAQLTLNKDYKKVEKPGQKPKNMILLEGAYIDCSYTNGSDSSQLYSYPGRQSASPSPSPHSSSQEGSGSGIITRSGNGSGTITSTGNMHPFNIVTKNGDIHEFLSESENDRLRWVKMLTILIMFPYSTFTIPDKPTNKPIKESLRSQLDPKRYGAGISSDSYVFVCGTGFQVHLRIILIQVHTFFLVLFLGNWRTSHLHTLDVM